MAVKKCCIQNCYSSSTRKEDIGVTYHKFPKIKTLREKWIIVTHYKHTSIDNFSYVCSRHFCKSDFKLYQDSKYILKSDAVPSIFSWVTDKRIYTKMETQNSLEETNNDEKLNTSTSSKDSEGENLEAIKKFIEDQEKEFQKKNCLDKDIAENVVKKATIENMDIIENVPIVIATSVMDMILSESEAKIANSKEIKHTLSPKDKGSSMTLSVGSKVEAKDFSECWHPAEIIEVDYDEMEVLIHYENGLNKHDEWINVNSPRLRPLKVSTTQTTNQEPTTSGVSMETFKDDAKIRVHFVVGERCLARWRDNRRFVATILNDFGNGHYEVMFDDGFQWKCTKSRLFKLKTSFDSGPGSPAVDRSMSPSLPLSTMAGSGSSIGQNVGQSVVASPNTSPLPIFHTHLFDPTRDYLGSKSERREMKRKINIKEIFNIGQKKRKKPSTSTEEKVVRAKKPNIIKHTKPKVVEVKNEMKMDLPDAVASIIGTVSNEEDVPLTGFKQDEINISILEVKNVEKVETDKIEGNITESENNEIKNDNTDYNEIKLSDNNDYNEIKLSDNNAIIDTENNEAECKDIKNNTKYIEAEKVATDINECLETEIQKIENTTKLKIEMEKIIIDQKPEQISSEESLHVNQEDASDLVKPSDLGFEIKTIEEPVMDEEVKLEKFEKPEREEIQSKQEVIEKMKEVINKLEEGLIDADKTPLKSDLKVVTEHENKADEVEIVKGELAKMKLQVEEMRQQIFSQPQAPARPREMPESFLLPGEWCCRWVDGDPVGFPSEVESEPKDSSAKLPRRSIRVEDKRLPPGWTKYMVQRSLGQSAGKWDVVLNGPENRRFHTKTDMRNFLINNNDESLQPYEYALLDFGVHLKLSRRMGWVRHTKESPVQKRINMSPLKRQINRKRAFPLGKQEKVKKRKISIKDTQHTSKQTTVGVSDESIDAIADVTGDKPILEDGYVYVGSLKVQIIDNLLRCPADGCFKNFRNNTLLQMHIKHYHRDLRKMLGATPKVLDLAKKRTKPTDTKPSKRRNQHNSKIIKVKIPKPPKRVEEPKQEEKPTLEVKPIIEEPSELHIDIPTTVLSKIDSPIPRSQDSPKLRQALATKPVKRPKVLLPVRRPDPEPIVEQEVDVSSLDYDVAMETEIPTEPLDFEAEMSTHTITKPIDDFRKKFEKKRRCFSTISKRPFSEEDEWAHSDLDTRSSFPESGTPDSKTMEKTTSHQQVVSSESNNEEQKETNMYMYTETGERVKIEHMKREEIINCHCGFREEDGLMVQCELCLCWQHALCHNIQKKSEVPEKYTCSICLNPRRGRRSKRFLHDQDRLYEGLLPGAKPCETLRRSHELSGNLLRIQDALHAIRVKYYVATKKDHPKLYLWAKDWDSPDSSYTQDRVNSDYSDLNIIINNIGKENLPVKPEEVRDQLDIRMPITEEPDQDRFNNSNNSLFSLTTALSSPNGGPSLDLPITTSELERLAKSVQEQEVQRNVTAPQPEAAIENDVCRERLLRHVQRCQALVDSRLDSIEAQVAELESQDPSFEDDETADFFPRTKQTIQMLMRDLDTMEELGIIA